MKFAMSLMAVAGIAAAANAATTLSWEVSTDGGATWASNAVATPGSAVQFRLRASLAYDVAVGPERGELGFAGINVLPRLSNFGGGDVAIPLSGESTPEGTAANPFGTRTYGASNLTVANAYFDPSLALTATALNNYTAGNAFNGPGVPTGSAPGGVVGAQVPGFGRQAPFAANGTGTNGIATSSVVGGELQWKATVIGNGVSFSQQAPNFSSISAVVVQGRNTGATTDDQRSSTPRPLGSSFPVGMQDAGEDGLGLSGFVLFTYGIILGNDGSARTLTQTGDALIAAKWYTNGTGSTSVEDIASMIPASVSIVPAPGALALLGLSGLVVARRRR